MADEIESRIDQIREIFPCAIQSVQVHDRGEDFLVLEVNQAWMFRFPRNPAARKALGCEKRFLPVFEPISPLAVPRIRYVGEEFIGYRKIKGVLLAPQRFRTLCDETQKGISRQIGEFLSALHAFPVEEAFRMGVTEGWDCWRARAYARFLACVAPLLSARARGNALEFFDQFFVLEWRPTLIHGDFYPPDHVFFDPESEELGVIDFGDLTVEDAATDFQSILEDFGAEFLQDALAHYSCATDAHFLDRIRIRVKACPLFDAPYALEYGLHARFAERLSEIELAFG